MKDSTRAAQDLDSYLQKLRAGLRDLPAADADEIIRELRSHILDRAGSAGELSESGVAAALARLGDSEDLAAQYATENLMARAERSRSPWLILRSIFRWASLSFAGFFVFLGALIGYTTAFAFLFCAAAKPFAPKTIGLWVRDASLSSFSASLGTVDSNSGGREVLGWWIIPIGMAAGVGLSLLTTRFGLWSIRRFRRSRARAA
jgi:uncharacterized membrane protein